MKMFKNSGVGIDEDHMDFYKNLMLWLAIIMFIVMFLFFNVVYQYFW